MSEMIDSPADAMDDGAFSEMMQDAGSIFDVKTDPAPLQQPEPEEESEDGYELEEGDEEAEEEAEEEEAEEGTEEEETEEETAPELTDETEIDIDTGEGGEPVKANLGALKEAYRNSETVRKAAQDLGQKYQELKEKHDNLENVYRMAAMEAQTEIDAYEGVDWLKLSRDNPENYAKHRAYYDSMIAKRDAIKGKFDGWKQEHEQTTLAERQRRAADALQTLQNDIGLTAELHESVKEYALTGLGFDEKSFNDIIDASTYKALYYAMQYSKGVREKNAKIKTKQNSNKAVAGKSSRNVTSKPKAQNPNGGAPTLPTDFSEWGID